MGHTCQEEARFCKLMIDLTLHDLCSAPFLTGQLYRQAQVQAVVTLLHKHEATQKALVYSIQMTSENGYRLYEGKMQLDTMTTGMGPKVCTQKPMSTGMMQTTCLQPQPGYTRDLRQRQSTGCPGSQGRQVALVAQLVFPFLIPCSLSLLTQWAAAFLNCRQAQLPPVSRRKTYFLKLKNLKFASLTPSQLLYLRSPSSHTPCLTQAMAT